MADLQTVSKRLSSVKKSAKGIIAKEIGAYQEGMKYGPVIVCIGEFFTLEGLEEQTNKKGWNK